MLSVAILGDPFIKIEIRYRTVRCIFSRISILLIGTFQEEKKNTRLHNVACGTYYIPTLDHTQSAKRN